MAYFPNAIVKNYKISISYYYKKKVLPKILSVTPGKPSVRAFDRH